MRMTWAAVLAGEQLDRGDTEAEEAPLPLPLLQSTERPHSTCASQTQVWRSCIQGDHTPPTTACPQIAPTGLT